MLLLYIIIAYFALLLGIAYYTSRDSTNHDFFIGGRNSNWFLVAFGMIGTSLSGVTFISVPGTVEKAHFTYFLVVLGYFLGYLVVAYVLLPLYYRLNLTSIYNYLDNRFGVNAYKTGALFFILSRTLGATLRLYLVINVLQLFILDNLGISFYITTFFILGMILLYTFKGGVKSIVWTDTLQTTFMLLGLFVCLGYVKAELGLSVADLWSKLNEKGYTDMFIYDVHDKKFFLKQILGGMFVTITMTGLDQEMMQKNISVRTLAGAQKNMLLFSSVMVVVNLAFLVLGGTLYLYAAQLNLSVTGDDLFPTVALQHLPYWVSVIFIVGLISALFPSADGAITALTSSFCIDILNIERRLGASEASQRALRQRVHLSFTALFLVCIVVFKWINDKSIISLILDIASYTYGPLLGLFAFGILTRRVVQDRFVPFVCIAAPVFCYFLTNSVNIDGFKFGSQLLFMNIFGNYKFGLELLFINGLLTFLGLWAISSRRKDI